MELEKIPEKKSRLTNWQERYNTETKSMVAVVGANLALYICILIPILLIGFIWTDIGEPVIGVGLLSDGAVTIALFIIGELMMSKVGADGGKLDAEYIEAKAEHKSLIKKVNEIGTMLMHPFCEWQIDIEYQETVTSRLKYVGLSVSEWQKVKDKSLRELKTMYGDKRGRAIYNISHTKPVELNEAMLMFDNEDMNARGGIPMSGEAFLKKKSHSISMIAGTAFTCLVTVSFAVSLTKDISFARVMYTALKLVGLLFRMVQGYARGAKAYNSIEVRQLQTKSSFLRQYIRFVEQKLYLNLGDRYGDISQYLCVKAEDDILPEITVSAVASEKTEAPTDTATDTPTDTPTTNEE